MKQRANNSLEIDPYTFFINVKLRKKQNGMSKPNVLVFFYFTALQKIKLISISIEKFDQNIPTFQRLIPRKQKISG